MTTELRAKTIPSRAFPKRIAEHLPQDLYLLLGVVSLEAQPLQRPTPMMLLQMHGLRTVPSSRLERARHVVAQQQENERRAQGTIAS